MISVPEPTYELVMRVLRESHTHPDARLAASKLFIAAAESEERDANFNNETPALCLAQI